MSSILRPLLALNLEELQIHYSRIRSLNLEDIEELAICFAKELESAS